MVNSPEIFARKIRVEEGGHDTFSDIFMQDVRTGGEMNPYGSNGDQNRAQFKRSPNIKFTSECCGLDLSMVFLLKSELGKKAGCSLCTKSLSPCIVLSFKCTAKAPLIIKD